VTTAPPPGAPVPPTAAPPPPPAQQGGGTSGFAIASLVLGIVSFFCLGFIFPVPILAIVFGHVALGRIATSTDGLRGRGLAIAGAVLGWIFLVPLLILSCVWLGYGVSNL